MAAGGGAAVQSRKDRMSRYVGNGVGVPGKWGWVGLEYLGSVGLEYLGSVGLEYLGSVGGVPGKWGWSTSEY